MLRSAHRSCASSSSSSSSSSSKSSLRRSLIETLEGRRLFAAVAALTDANALLLFGSDKPTDILAARQVTGLQPGETLVGIDVRPSTGELYGLGSTARLYTISPATGVATLKAALGADPADVTDPFNGSLRGTDFGIDFNPVTDRLRVVSDTEWNLRVNPDDGTSISDDPLAYVTGDANFGADPSVIDAAYTNNTAGAASTTLLGLDQGPRQLVNIGGEDGTPPPDTGQLTTVQAFLGGGTVVETRGLDISTDGLFALGGYFPNATPALFVFGGAPVGEIGTWTAAAPIGDGQTPIVDVAVLPSVQFAAVQYAAGEGSGAATITVTRTEGGPGTFTVDYRALGGSATSGSDFVPASGTLSFAPGETSKTFSVVILNDDLPEGDEFVALSLYNPQGGAVVGSPGAALLRINAEDGEDKAKPTVLNVRLTGPTTAINGAIVEFSEDMDPATAGNVANYQLAARPAGRGRPQPIVFDGAAYDPVLRRTVLTIGQPFDLSTFGTLELRLGKGISDGAGNRLTGATRLKFNVLSGESVTINDRDGDVATIGIAGRQLDALVPVVKGKTTQSSQLWISDESGPLGILTGSVQPRGDGVVHIAEVIGLAELEPSGIFFDPSFRFGSLKLSGAGPA